MHSSQINNLSFSVFIISGIKLALSVFASLNHSSVIELQMVI